jgi:hypothetical protein
MSIRLIDVIAPIIVAVIYISAVSLFKEPQRRNFNAIMIAGAGAAYLNGGFGVWEFAWCFAGGQSILKTRTGAVEQAFR